MIGEVMFSKRSAKCAGCVHCIDFSLDSAFPISCGNSGRAVPFTDETSVETVKKDFCENGKIAIPKDANCPNYEQADGLQPNNPNGIWSILAAAYREWPTGKAMKVINRNEKWSFLR